MTSDALPDSTPRVDSSRGVLRLVPLILFVLALVVVAFNTPPKGDEKRGYIEPFTRAVEVWPRLNTTEVHHGLSPLYLWVTGGLGRLPGGPIPWARIVSLLCFVPIVLTCLYTKEANGRLALLALFNPFVVFYAVRGHPIMPAMLFLWLGWLNARRRPALGYAGILAAAHLQIYLGAAALFWAFAFGESRKEKITIFCRAAMWALLGICLNWWLIGGIYSESFYRSLQYQREHLYGSPSLGLLLLAPVCWGGTCWLLGCRAKTSIPMLLLGLAAGAIAALLLHATRIPTGTIQAITDRFGSAGPLLWGLTVLALAAGLARWPRSFWQLAVGSLPAVLFFSSLPFLYERLVWFACYAPAVLWAGLQPPEAEPPPLRRRATLAVLGVGTVVYLVLGRQ